MAPKLEHEECEKSCAGLIKALSKEYRGILKIDLDRDVVTVLKSQEDPGSVGKIHNWDSFRAHFNECQVFPEDRELVWELSLESLKAFFDGKEQVFPIEIRCLCDDRLYDWLRFSAERLEGNTRQLLITSRINNEDRILRKIVDLYVYQNFDYFVLLDSEKNSYTMFSGREGTPLPPESGSDYVAEVARYNARYVVPEEVQTVNSRMSVANVKSMLEQNPWYEFTAGFINDEGEYRRSRIQFTYYDKAAGLILITRMDVTQLYLLEMERERELSAALREAQHDPLTGLYNKKATNELVNGTLERRYRAQAALLFIDIDNFKLANDTLGHQNGDRILCHMGSVLSSVAGKDGIAGRIGGDEFLLFLPLTRDIEQIKQYAQQICFVLKSLRDPDIGDLPVSCSVGIAMYPSDGTKYDQLLYKADQALYDAKRYGKCKYAFYSKETKNL